MTDLLPTTYTDGPLSVTHRLARHLNKRLGSVRLHCTLLEVCAEFSFVYGNNQCMLLYKMHILSTTKPGREGAVVSTTPTGRTMGQSAQSGDPTKPGPTKPGPTKTGPSKPGTTKLGQVDISS